MADRETSTLIGSNKVDGTAVYGADGAKIGRDILQISTLRVSCGHHGQILYDDVLATQNLHHQRP